MALDDAPAEIGAVRDLRPILFQGASWYESLQPPTDDSFSPWWGIKSPADDPLDWVPVLLSACAEFARDHDLLEVYRSRFAAIRPVDLTPQRAAANGRAVSAPVWDIAHELVVARYLERVLGWEYECHEPPGNKGRKGDWQFRTRTGRGVFIEVKTVEEPQVDGTRGPHNRSVRYDRIRDVVKGAYKQLPDDERATLVVLVGREILSIPFSILFTDIAQTLFGTFQVRFNALFDDPDFRAGPAFTDMLVHGTKHRRLGCVAGLPLTGLGLPEVRFYAIDNPYASLGKRLTDEELANARRFVVDAQGAGLEKPGLDLAAVWERMEAKD